MAKKIPNGSYYCPHCKSSPTEWNHPSDGCPVECWETYYGHRDGLGPEETCICGRVATSEYEGVASCGRPICEFRIQQALDYNDERGNG